MTTYEPMIQPDELDKIEEISTIFWETKQA